MGSAAPAYAAPAYAAPAYAAPAYAPPAYAAPAFAGRDRGRGGGLPKRSRRPGAGRAGVDREEERDGVSGAGRR
jgi:hypothetical protein